MAEAEPAADAAAGAGEEEEWPTSAEGYKLEVEIGYGAFATVYRASTVAAATGRPEQSCAVKIIDLEELNVNWEEVRREISIMRRLQHPNVVPVLQAFVEEEELWIVMPLLEGGSCVNIMKGRFEKGVKDDGVLAYVLHETLKGLAYLHANGHVHRDLKASNVLVGSDGQVMLGDFGVAGTLMEPGDREKKRTTFTGTPCWMAPEVMEQKEYDYKADMWSFGITALELAYGRAPYAHFQPMKVLMLTLQEEPPTPEIYKDNSHRFTSKFASMVEKCLRKEPDRRPAAAKLIEHKFFRRACEPAAAAELLLSGMKELGHDARPIPSRKKERKEQANHKPVSIDSWIFDVNDLKRQAEEEAAAAAAAAAAAGGTSEPVAEGKAAEAPAEAPAAAAAAATGSASDTDEDAATSTAESTAAPAAVAAGDAAAGESAAAGADAAAKTEVVGRFTVSNDPN